MSKKGIFLFDIDKTLFDTPKFIEVTSEKLAKLLEVDLSDISLLDKEYTSTLKHNIDFDPETFADFLCRRFGFKNKKLIEDIYYTEKSYYERNVFSDVKEVLNKLIVGFNLGIFSEGTKRFQNHKFRSLGLNDYFGKDIIFIQDAKDTEEIVKELPVGAVIVDDKEDICEFVTKHGFHAIWLNKKDNKVSDKFQTIHHLTELPSMLL